MGVDHDLGLLSEILVLPAYRINPVSWADPNILDFFLDIRVNSLNRENIPVTYFRPGIFIFQLASKNPPALPSD